VVRWDQFDGERDAEALARFDALTEPQPARPAASVRRVRANAATANAAGVDAAFATRDADALGALFAEDSETVHHPTGATWNRQGALARFRSGFRAREVTLAHEPLATLGDALALCRMSWSGSGASGGGFDVGAYEGEQIALIEADAHGQRHRAEFFADDRLADAVARFYERYAELLPDGPARTRAAVTARSVAVLLEPADPDRYAESLAPAIEFVDHRRLISLGSAHGAEAVLRGVRTLLSLSLVNDAVGRVADLLGLQSDAILIRWTISGTVRASGGAYERQYLQLWTFGADGLATRIEWFDLDDEALARFDALTADPAAESMTAAPSRAAEKREP
jgi:ketosteroid isomerase-like protein